MAPFVVEARLDAVEHSGAIVAAANVVLAGPDQFDRDAVAAHGLGGGDRIDGGEVVVVEVQCRPKPPPANWVWICTCSGVRPVIFAVAR